MPTTNSSTNLSEVDSMPYNTTPYIYFNQTNFYEVASIPVSGLTYTLFGFTCFLACLGLSGNISILAITLKSRDKWKGHDILITALAVADIVALASLSLSQPCFYEVLDRDVRAITTIGCKLFLSVCLSAMFSSSMVVVLISVERFEPVHEISNNLVCATSKASDQPAHTRSLIRAFACRLSILWLLSYWPSVIWSF